VLSTRSVYNRYRYYDPQTGSFISQDPIGLLGGENPYQFAPNLFQWIDPLGLSDFLFRGDDNYARGSNIGSPLGSGANITTPWDHVRRESSQTSIFTSFSESRAAAGRFTKTGNISKISWQDLKKIEADGLI
jgi:uncharacterized protein RhaS with RHS repeats